MVGKGSLNHNSREFYASNVDPNRSHLNIEFCREDIRNVYHKEHNMTYNDLGRWANMRFEFIKQHRPQLYQSLLKENKLHSYLVEFDRQVQDTLILTEEQMRQTEGITEELKRQDQLEWVCRMNNIRSRAEEIVTAEFVCK